MALALEAKPSKAVPEPERVALSPGQTVEVRTRRGDVVASGTIQEVNRLTRTVRVTDSGSGADLQIDVNPDVYDVWVIPARPFGGKPNVPERNQDFIRPALGGPFSASRFDV